MADQNTITLSHPLTLAQNEGGNTLVVSWTGEVDALKEKLNSIQFFRKYDGQGASLFPEGGSTTADCAWTYPFAARASIVRENGPVARLDLTVLQVRKGGVWGLDFVEVQRPILSWRKPGAKPSDTDEKSVPNVAKLKAWMKIGEEDPTNADYAGFKVDGEDLKDATKTVAEMIYKGVETYPVQLPVATWQCRVFDPPDVQSNLPGKLMNELKAPHGIKEIGEKGFLDNLIRLSSPWTGENFKWLRSGNRVAQNPDGTYLWTVTFQAVEDADSDLYPSE